MKSLALNTSHDILFLDSRPWKNRTYSEAKYKQLYEELKNEVYSYQPLYEVVFPKPLNAKRKYYQALIENEIIQYLNSFRYEFSSSLTENEKGYWVHTSLTKVIAQKLRDVKSIVETFNLDLANISNKLIDSNTQDDIYIIQYMRFQVLRIYLEIQNGYKTHLKDEALSYDELNEKYFSESVNHSYIIEATKINLLTPVDPLSQTSNKANFELKTFDIRASKKGVLSYTDLIKNPDRFSRFEELLFTNGLIDENYKFKKEHGQIQELAAIFQTIIAKGYFNQRKFPGNKIIKPIEVRKFLDHRYDSNTDKQFRDWSNDSNGLADFVSKRYWIDKLPLS